MRALLKDGRIVNILGVENEQYITDQKEKIDFDDFVKAVEQIPFWARFFKSIYEAFKKLFTKNEDIKNE
jgi:hypothetical protein